jgi:hypothetical protein
MLAIVAGTQNILDNSSESRVAQKCARRCTSELGYSFLN